jgi:hypothetical protein
MKIFDCDDQGPMREYIGCKVDYDDEKKQRCTKITQPVLVQSLSDEFELNMDNLVVTPGVPGQVLGLVQAAIVFWHKLVLAFAKIGFRRSKADPCVFISGQRRAS